ncbi:hypothetical protein F5Y17DRAFT_294927 [Xylariaceae sp. FL0594]|nr:hypothetical protein F5Y17DRAFT_294927 [Xylariaceae sp. FL0594]
MDRQPDNHVAYSSVPVSEPSEANSGLSSDWSLLSMSPDTSSELFSFTSPFGAGPCINKGTGMYIGPPQTLPNYETGEPWAAPRLHATPGSASFTGGHAMDNRVEGIVGHGAMQHLHPASLGVANPSTGRLPNRQHHWVNLTFQEVDHVPVRANFGTPNFPGGLNTNTDLAVQLANISAAPFSMGGLGYSPRVPNGDGSVYGTPCPVSQCCYASGDCLEDHCDVDDCQADNCYDKECYENDCHESIFQGEDCQADNCPYVCTNCYPPKPQFESRARTEAMAPVTQEGLYLDFSAQDPCPLPHDQPSNHTRMEHHVAQTLQVLSAQGVLEDLDQTTNNPDWEPPAVEDKISPICLWICNPDASPPERRVCGQLFSDAAQLNEHVCHAHTAKLNSRTKYMCLWEGCIRKEDQYFTSRAKLDRHMPTHTAYKPMSCPICHLALSSQQALEQHQRTHTKEKPYACDKCDKTFTTKSSLSTHQRIHDGNKPLRCDVCNKEFGDSSNLSKHKATHKEKTKHCPFPGCPSSFCRPDQLRRHMKVHSVQPDLACQRKRKLDKLQESHTDSEKIITQNSLPTRTELVELLVQK